MYTMAIDPGGITGIAFRMPDNSLVTCTANSQEQVWDYFLGDMRLPQQVVLEEWQYFNGIVTPAGNHTADICAGIRGICYILHIPLALKSPQARFPRQRQAEEWYKKEKHVKTLYKKHSHECDALAHLLAWEALHPELQKQLQNWKIK